MAPWFPFNYRDIAGWKTGTSHHIHVSHIILRPPIVAKSLLTECGIELSTTSDEAAKFFDATIAQTVLMDTDQQGSCSALVLPNNIDIS